MSFDPAELDRSEWSLGRAAFEAIVSSFSGRGPPARILEFGSGASTRGFASTWPDAEIVAVDHDAAYLPTLTDLPASARIRLTVVELKHRVVCGVPTLTYDFNPDGTGFDLALVDGPPRRLGNGRLGALLLAYNALRPGGVVFLDDAYRASELKALSRLSEMTGVRPRFIDVGHGLAMLVRGAPAHAVPAVSIGAGVETLGKAVAAFVRR